MLYRLLLALALAAGVSSAAQAQTVQVVPSCSATGVNTAVGPGGVLVRDQSGNLCTSAVGSSGQAVAPSAASGSAIAPTVTRGASVMTAKASAGNLYGFSLTQGATAGFFAFIDAAAAPASGAAIAPIECVAVPASGYVARRQDIADRYTAGIQIVSTSSCTTYTAVTPVQMSASVQ